MNLNCTICGDFFKSTDDVNITPCGHMFHNTCSRPWFKKKQSCPKCRNKCCTKAIHKVNFTRANNNVNMNMNMDMDNSSLDDMGSVMLSKMLNELKKTKCDVNELRIDHRQHMKMLMSLRNDVEECKCLIHKFKEQFKILNQYSDIIKEQQGQMKELRLQIDHLSKPNDNTNDNKTNVKVQHSGVSADVNDKGFNFGVKK